MEASPLFIRINVGYGLLPQLSDLFLTGKSLLDTYEKDKMVSRMLMASAVANLRKNIDRVKC